MRALITGITGFVGSHLAELLLKEGFETFGAIRWRSRMDNVLHLQKDVAMLECDMKDATSVKKLLSETKPDYIFHLAAQSFVPTSWNAPAETLVTNIIGQVNIFQACRELGLDPAIQLACSSEEYGMVYEDEVPIVETNPLRPLSPYGVSKTTQDMLGYQYWMSYKTRAIRTRTFNHEGPRRGQVFVTSNFCHQVASIEKGLQKPVMKVGNLDAVRDFTDVRDVVRAYLLAVQKCDPGDVYNICSGKGYSIQQLLDMLLAASTTPITVEQDPTRMRPSDVPLLVGDCSKFRAKTGWQPEIPFEQTVEDLLNYWRERV